MTDSKRCGKSQWDMWQLVLANPSVSICLNGIPQYDNFGKRESLTALNHKTVRCAGLHMNYHISFLRISAACGGNYARWITGLWSSCLVRRHKDQSPGLTGRPQCTSHHSRPPEGSMKTDPMQTRVHGKTRDKNILKHLNFWPSQLTCFTSTCHCDWSGNENFYDSENCEANKLLVSRPVRADYLSEKITCDVLKMLTGSRKK